MLSHLFWGSGELPVDWKLANGPVFRKRKEAEPGNSRPVRLSLVPGRTMEEILLGVTEQQLKDSVPMGHSQHPFTKGRNRLTNFISLRDKATILVDQRKPIDVVFLDFSKVFDSFSHSILLEKMSRIWIDKNTMQRVCNWLMGQAQRVIVNEVTSG